MSTDIGPFISAAVGLLGVGVGLTGDLIRRRWQRPNLELLRYVPDAGDAVYFDLFTTGNQAAYLRLGVRNTGREVARDVEVCIERIVDHETAPNARRREIFQRQPIGGLIGRRLKWADRDEVLIDIPPGTLRRVDIVNVYSSEPSYRDEAGDLHVPVRLTLSKQSGIHRDIISGLSYSITLSLTASNTQAKMFVFSLKFGGIWRGEQTIERGSAGSLTVGGIVRVD